jgi:carboxyl-terminal processing protease
VPRIATVILATASALAAGSGARAQDPQPPAAPAQAGPRDAGAQQPADPAPQPADAYRWFDPIIDLRAIVTGAFVSEPDAAAMQRAAMAAMVAALGDPYSTYIAPDEERWLRTQVSGTYVGIGVELDVRDGFPVVVTAIDDSPALEAGILPGDQVIEVDGRSTEGIEFAELESLLPGQPGTACRLRLRRPDGTERELAVTRRVIETRSVKGIARGRDGWTHALDRDRRIGYVRIASFTERTLAELDAAIAEMEADGLSGLVVDLRNNGGGSLDAAVGAVDRFLSSGAIVSTRGRGETGSTWDGTGGPRDVLVPLVVLVNRASASASEVMAGALRDQGRAKLVGERTYGKGSVQRIFPLPDGAGTVKLTTARYSLPSGRTVTREPGAPKWGVEPDTGFHVPMTEQDFVASNAARQARESGAGAASGDAARAVNWANPGSIRRDAHDPQLAAAVTLIQGYLDSLEWEPVGGLSGDVGAANDELRATLELRRRLLAELRRADDAISSLRAGGAGVDDPIVAPDADLIDGEVELRDREGRIVGRWIVKDPATVRRTIGPGTRVAPEFVPAREPGAPDGAPQAPRAGAPGAGAANEPEAK